MHRLSIRLFESGFTSPVTTPSWNPSSKVRSVRWEYQKRYLRQEFESDLPFEVKFTAKLGDGEISYEMVSELVEDHIISRYSVVDDNEAEIDDFYDQPCDESEIPDLIERIVAREEAYNRRMEEDLIFSNWLKANTKALDELFGVDEDEEDFFNDDSRDWSDIDKQINWEELEKEMDEAEKPVYWEELDSAPSQEEMKAAEEELKLWQEEDVRRQKEGKEPILPPAATKSNNKPDLRDENKKERPDIDEFCRRIFEILDL